MVRRGSYAKGIAKREEILRVALDVVAREGFRGASVRELADAVGLSQAGLLHYFGSKEELFVEILRTRDRVDVATFGEPDDGAFDLDTLTAGYLRIIRHNTQVPGLVQLFVQMSADATDPQHPAHAYFLERSAAFRTGFEAALARGQEAGVVTDRMPAETLARALQSVWDGAQLQWVVDPTVDVADIVGSFLAALVPSADPSRSGTAHGDPRPPVPEAHAGEDTR